MYLHFDHNVTFSNIVTFRDLHFRDIFERRGLRLIGPRTTHKLQYLRSLTFEEHVSAEFGPVNIDQVGGKF